MARNGAPPKPVVGRKCKVPYCEVQSIDRHLFCATHEMLWIGVAKVSSHNLKPQYGRRYRRFLKKEGDKLNPYAHVMGSMQGARFFVHRGAGKTWRIPSGK